MTDPDVPAGINLSLGEFAALVLKSFRGVGYPWGLAEEAAQAARTLASDGRAAGEAVVGLLGVIDGGPVADFMPDGEWRSPSGSLCPVCTGAVLTDFGQSPAALGDRLAAVVEPSLLLPSAPSSPRALRVGLSPAAHSALESWAHRTYAPETDASRIAGAGAGLTDND